MPAHLQGPLRVGDRQPAEFGHFFQGRLAAFVMDQVAIDVADLAHFFDHVHRHADGAALVGDGAADRLANPPRGVGREAEAAGVLELVDGPHQPRIAFLDQVQEAQAAIAVALGDRDDQAEVACRQVAACRFMLLAHRRDPCQMAAQAGRGFPRDPHQAASFPCAALRSGALRRRPTALLPAARRRQSSAAKSA